MRWRCACAIVAIVVSEMAGLSPDRSREGLQCFIWEASCAALTSCGVYLLGLKQCNTINVLKRPTTACKPFLTLHSTKNHHGTTTPHSPQTLTIHPSPSAIKQTPQAGTHSPFTTTSSYKNHPTKQPRPPAPSCTSRSVLETGLCTCPTRLWLHLPPREPSASPCLSRHICG